MLDLLGSTKPLMPRRVAVWGALLGAFGLGLAAGKLLAGAKPFDWTLDIMNLALVLGWTVWCTVAALRDDTTTGNADVPARAACDKPN
jgi:hypothetical protein